ncbi:hypothetical protein K490DRAFT_63826 [Saccharata proteae CBS 121410]|uniref:Uncharacterized protein n=1 Tax=Saccharata proteae CBS 121410 TaxID=1314787 RepID=A0A6A5YFX0_9PEZI|nr:hypothetical protein K490DRAFT_63826 [Saccharata proteae CBS 121410]
MSTETKNGKPVVTEKDIKDFFLYLFPDSCKFDADDETYEKIEYMNSEELAEWAEPLLSAKLQDIAKKENTDTNEKSAMSYIHRIARRMTKLEPSCLKDRVWVHAIEIALDNPPTRYDTSGLAKVFRDLIHGAQGHKGKDWKPKMPDMADSFKSKYYLGICRTCHKKPRGSCATCLKWGHPQPAKYCSPECQRKDAARHEPACHDWSNAVKRQRATDLLRDIYLVVMHHATQDSWGKIESKNGVLYHHQPRGLTPKQPFPNGNTQADKDRRSIMMHCCCQDFPGKMHHLIKHFLKEVAVNFPGLLDPNIRRLHTIIITNHYSHFSKEYESSIFDATGIQYGWEETLVKESVYADNRLVLGDETRRLPGYCFRHVTGSSDAWQKPGALHGPAPNVLHQVLQRWLSTQHRLTINQFFNQNIPRYEQLRADMIDFCLKWLEHTDVVFHDESADWYAFPQTQDVCKELEEAMRLPKPDSAVDDIAEGLELVSLDPWASDYDELDPECWANFQ